MSSKSIITVILRQRVNRAAGAARRAAEMKGNARATEKSLGTISQQFDKITNKDIPTFNQAITSYNNKLDAIEANVENVNIMMQSQALRILTVFQMTRFMAEDMKQIMAGEDVLINMVSLGTSALLTAFQIQAITIQNIALQKTLNKEMAFSGVFGAVASINPLYMAGAMIGGSMLMSMGSGGTSNSKRQRDINRMAYRRITG